MLVETDLSWRGFGFSWGHRRSYANIVDGGTSPGPNGLNWFVEDQPYLVFDVDPGSSLPTVGVIFGTFSSKWFIDDESGGWAPQLGSRYTLTHDSVTHTFTLTAPSGLRTDFHDDSTWVSVVLRGCLKTRITPGGDTAAVDWTETGEIHSISFSDAAGTENADFTYDYYPDSPRGGLLRSVTLRVDGHAVRRSRYDYHVLGSPNGPEKTLAWAKVEEIDATGIWQPLREQVYRYFQSTGSGAWLYGIRLMLDAQGVSDARDAGFDLSSASDAELVPYASHRFLYDEAGRVVEEFVRGGESHYQFGWMTRSTDPGFAAVNQWYRRCIETRPDASTYTVYTNRSGSPLFSIMRDTETGDEWAEFREYNANHHRTILATPAAIASWTEPADPTGTLSVTLKVDVGLIHVDTYYEADDLPAGEVRRYLATQGVKEGSEGTLIEQRRIRYDTHNVGTVSIHPIRREVAFPVAGASEDDAAVTDYVRFPWHLDALGQPTFQAEQLTTIPPVVPEDQHGTDEEEPRFRIFDIEGFPIWEKDARGIITWHAWDRTTGAEIRRIDDADPELLPNPPAEWVAPSFGGTHLVTDFVNDTQGRRLREIGPEHIALIDGDVVLPCQAANVRAVALRTVRYSLPVDPRRQRWSASGYVIGRGTTEESWHILGTISIERMDEAGRIVDVLQVRPECPCGPLSTASAGRIDVHSGLPARQLWTKWTRTLRDRWGRETGNRVYMEIPLVEGSDGFEGENYRLSQFGYDAMNRVVRSVSPDGTISRFVFDVRNQIVAEWIGTDDAEATSVDPSGAGAYGNNMKPVLLREFDGGEEGGNGNLTSERRPVDDDPTHDRVTAFAYDFRDRRILTERHDGTRAFISVTDYDNLDQIVANTDFHHSIADANRIGRSETLRDPRGRDYQRRHFGADPTTGVLTPALVSGTWYDPDNNIIAATQPGVKATSKTVFDALNRAICHARVVAGTDSPDGSANDLTNDLVVEQNDTTYDRGGNIILTIRFERLPESTGNGPLHGPGSTEPRARRSFFAIYHDGIGRHRYAVDFGTNGGAVLDRTELPPPPSDLVLVSETRYAADGQPGFEIGPDGVINRTKRNRLGEVVEVTEAFGTPAQRVARYCHHSSGKPLRMILENPDTGEQATTWLFGTALATNGVARNDLVTGQIYPTGESESYTFNRQGESTTFTDANGTVRELRRDKLGRPTDDSAIVLADGVDGTIRRVSASFNDQGMPEFFTTSADPDPGSASVINQVQQIYDAFRLLIADRQEHDGAVNAGTPTVSYQNTSGAGNVLRRAAVIAPSGARIDFNYGLSGSITDVFNQVESLKIATEVDDLVAYNYAGVGRIATLTYETPGVQLSYLQTVGVPGQTDAGDELAGYDRFNRTILMPWRQVSDGSVLADLAYGFDRASRRTWRQDLTPAAQASFDRFYGYDNLGQVISADLGTLNRNHTGIGGIPTEAEAWKYDEQGNWLGYRRDEDGATEVTQTRVHNRANQIKIVDGTNAGVAYDRNGNMLRVPTGDVLEGPPRRVKWNAWNQMVEIRDHDDLLIQQNSYDALFRRTTRSLADETVIHCYYNAQWRPVEERTGSSSVPSAVYYWGVRHRDDLARRDRDANETGTLDESLWCLMDYFDPVAVVTDDGAVVERYTFTSFGVNSILAPDYSPLTASLVAWNFLFHGQFGDVETGWYNYGYRFYLPMLGGWPSRDPIGERGGRNLYGFVGNDVINKLDHLGLVLVTLEAGAGRGLAVWGKVEFEFEEEGECSDGTKCWRGTLSADAHAGLGLGVKYKAPNIPLINQPSNYKDPLGDIGLDLFWHGPNLNREMTIDLAWTCDSMGASTSQDIISYDNDFGLSGSIGFGLVSLSGEANVHFDFYVRLHVQTNANEVNVRLVRGLATSGDWSYVYGGRIPFTDITFGDADSGTFIAPEKGESPIFEKTFPI